MTDTTCRAALADEREKFEAWARSEGLILRRLVNDERFESMETEWAHRAWAAARSALAQEGQAVAVAQVTDEGYEYPSHARVQWLLNPMPPGSLLYEGTGGQT